MKKMFEDTPTRWQVKFFQTKPLFVHNKQQIAWKIQNKFTKLSLDVLTGAWCPRGIESIEKVVSFEIGFQDLEEILNLTKI